MDRRPFLRNRELSELSPLTQSTPGGSNHGGVAGAPGLTRNHSYGSILPYLGFLRNSLRRSASSSSQTPDGRRFSRETATDRPVRYSGDDRLPRGASNLSVAHTFGRLPLVLCVQLTNAHTTGRIALGNGRRTSCAYPDRNVEVP
uniref:Uncharacterized protein n=1 Tax=Anopheles farauti TaxID=69004 RepID=A0A182QVI7_9DIPT